MDSGYKSTEYEERALIAGEGHLEDFLSPGDVYGSRFDVLVKQLLTKKCQTKQSLILTFSPEGRHLNSSANFKLSDGWVRVSIRIGNLQYPHLYRREIICNFRCFPPSSPLRINALFVKFRGTLDRRYGVEDWRGSASSDVVLVI
ncbi:hypothetical protein AVEN_182489-1 [Araneus ventricosus]|uniref:Uncharacterized protein n=1 Tax=Araneus ventricosus TaxID=182803 RepID=A0A4Y2BXK3_ARAVE|nr:hypothetical protein AVEN_182489-1 [Araneus ventricosus]